MRSLVARAAATVAAGVALALLPAAAASAATTVSITAPGPGVLAGTIQVSVSAQASDPGDAPSSVELRVDGALVNGSNTACPPDAVDATLCSVTIPWDSTAALGAHSLTAVFYTALGPADGTTSDAVAVTIEKVPTVGITSPTGGSPVSGPIDVALTAGTAPGDADPPASVALTATPTGGSPATVGTLPCDHVAVQCSGSVHWTPAGLDGAVTLTATVTTVNGLTRSATASVVVESPTVAITSPVAAASVTGSVQVSVHAASTQAVADPLASVALLVDGAVVDTLPCTAPASGACDLVLAWNAGPVPVGAHTLAARLTTTLGLVVPSAQVGVTVVPPSTTITISAPRSRSVVRGTVRVGVTAVTDEASGTTPRRVDLFIDGVAAVGRGCPDTASRSCTVTVPWSTAGLAGSHRITARIATTSGAAVFSVRTWVWVWTGTAVRLPKPVLVPAGRTVTLTGRVVSTTTSHGLPGAPVRITSSTALRSGVVARLTTAADGTFHYTFRASASTRLVVSTSSPWTSASGGAVTQLVRAPVKCRLSTTSIASGGTGTGSCTVASLPAGTPVALYYSHRGRTTVLARGAARGATIPFTFRFTARGFYSLKVVVGTSALYVGATSAAMGVTVR